MVSSIALIKYNASSIDRGTQQPTEVKEKELSAWDRGVADGLK